MSESGAAEPEAEAGRRIASEARERVRFEEEALELADQVYRVARRMVGTREEAEELVQDTYARAFRSWRSFTPGTNMRAWLLRILTNLNIDRGRKHPAHARPAAARGERLLPREQARRRGGRAGARPGARRRAALAGRRRRRARRAAARLPRRRRPRRPRRVQLRRRGADPRHPDRHRHVAPPPRPPYPEADARRGDADMTLDRRRLREMRGAAAGLPRPRPDRARRSRWRRAISTAATTAAALPLRGGACGATSGSPPASACRPGCWRSSARAPRPGLAARRLAQPHLLNSGRSAG